MNRFEQFTDEELDLLFFELDSNECFDHEEDLWCNSLAQDMCREIIEEIHRRKNAVLA